MKRKKSEGPGGKGRILRIAILCFALYVSYSMVTQQAQIRERDEELAAVKAMIVQQEQKNKKVERLLTLGDDEEYIERIAKEKLGYAYPNEHVYIDRSAE